MKSIMPNHLNQSIGTTMNCISELNEWERQHIQILNSVIGRHVYFCIVNELLRNPNSESTRSIKQVFKHADYTDRAIRLKLRELEKNEWITYLPCQSDKRERILVPTPKLLELIEMHGKYCKRLLEKKYLILEK